MKHFNCLAPQKTAAHHKNGLVAHAVERFLGLNPTRHTVPHSRRKVSPRFMKGYEPIDRPCRR